MYVLYILDSVKRKQGTECPEHCHSKAYYTTLKILKNKQKMRSHTQNKTNTEQHRTNKTEEKKQEQNKNNGLLCLSLLVKPHEPTARAGPRLTCPCPRERLD